MGFKPRLPNVYFGPSAFGPLDPDWNPLRRGASQMFLLAGFLVTRVSLGWTIDGSAGDWKASLSLGEQATAVTIAMLVVAVIFAGLGALLLLEDDRTSRHS